MAGDSLRAFAAIGLPPTIADWLAGVVREGRRLFPAVRWVDPAAAHLTLKFLGEVPRERIGEILAAMRGAVGSPGPITLSLGGLGAFPSPGNPRVIHLEVVRGREHVCRLMEAVDGGMASLGFPRETRAPSPHVTVGRVKTGLPRNSFQGWIGDRREGGGMPWQAWEFGLYRSELRPAGPIYHLLGAVSLGTGSGQLQAQGNDH